MDKNLDIIFGNFINIAEKILNNDDSENLEQHLNIYQNFFKQINQLATNMDKISEDDLEKLKQVILINEKIESILKEKKEELRNTIIRENKKINIKKKYTHQNNQLGYDKKS